VKRPKCRACIPAGEYDLAGFAVGIVEKAAIIDGSTIIPGDVLLGLPSSGAHSNGYSLLRKIIASRATGPDAGLRRRNDARRCDPGAHADLCESRCWHCCRQLPVKGMAHITGGGLTGNVPRILPPAGQGRDRAIGLAASEAVRLAAARRRRRGQRNAPRLQLRDRHGRRGRPRERPTSACRSCMRQAKAAVVIGAIKVRSEGEAGTMVVSG
jgi:hypothetical protein